MTGKEFSIRLKNTGITATAFARYIGRTTITVAKWKSGESPVPELVADKLVQLEKAIEEVFPHWTEKKKGKK